MRYFIRLYLILFLVGSTFKGLTQINVSPSNGCLPGITNANFTYLGPPASALLWNFGDGSPTTSITSPQHSYLVVGNYIVTCVATIGASTQTFTFAVSVNPNPTGSFSFNAPQSGCAPRTVTFTGVSSSPGVNFSWSFGDNSLGGGASNAHTYNSQGSFNPVLTIQNPLTSCFVNVQASGPIHVSSLPVVSIVNSPGTFSCSAPFTTAFNGSGSSSGSPITGGSLTYNWNFGNGQTSGAANPGNITYINQGTYNASLTLTDNNNCSNTGVVLISAVMPSVQITTPNTVCINYQTPPSPISPNFTASVVSSQTTTLWDMGDGTPIFNFPFPVNNVLPALTPGVVYTSSIHAYATPGPKVITVTAYAGTCVATATKNIFVERIIPTFSTAPHVYTCSPSIVANYTNFTTVNTGSSLSYTWFAPSWNNPNFGQTLFSTNATFNLSQGSTNPYAIYTTYAPNIWLFVESSLGCITHTTQIYDSIRRPTAVFNESKKEGCAPLNVTYSDSSFTNSAFFPITSYTWCNGASPPTFSTGTVPLPPNAGSVIPNANFTYTAVGTYSPYLIIQTQGGCTHTSYSHTITVVDPPSINITVVPSPSVCANGTVQVHLGSSGPNPQHWHVDSDAGFFSGCINDLHPVWQFNHLGIFGFTVSAYLNSCKSTSVSAQTISVGGPIARARYETNCNNKLEVKFDYLLEEVSTATLSFGGPGSPSVTILGNPSGTVNGSYTFTYAAPGNYTATLYGINSLNGCGPSTQTMLVTVRQPTAEFTFDPVFCRYDLQNFTALTSTNNLVGGSTGYTWFIDNLAPKQYAGPTLTESFTVVGTHSLILRVKDVNGCVDTTMHLFRVTEPVPTFTFNFNPICFSQNPAQIFNTTLPSPDALTSYTWAYFNPGQAMYNPLFGTYLSASDSNSVTTNATQNHTFTIPAGSVQTFTVRLRAKDQEGCVNTHTQVIQVNNPIAAVAYIQNTCTPGPPRIFSAFSSTNYVTYSWDLNNGTPIINAPTNTVSASYPISGSYTPTLVITDINGCTAQWSQNFSIQSFPVASYTYVNKINSVTAAEYCLPVTLTLQSTSSFSWPVYYVWDLGLPPSTPATPNTTAGTSYTAAGTYTLKLTVFNTTAPGCQSVFTKTVSIYNEPKADMELIPTTFCLGELITASIKNSVAVDHWQWDWGNSQPTQTLSALSQTTISFPYTYFPSNPTGTVQIILTAYSPGEVCKDINSMVVKVIKVNADFKRNNELALSDYMHCLGIPDTFSNTTTSNSNILTYLWSFGDGQQSTLASPNYNYTSPGNFSVSLVAKDPAYGCTNTVIKTMTVLPLPSASITVQNLACPDSLFLIQGSGLPGLTGPLTGTVLSPGSSYSVSFNAANQFTLNASATANTIYTLQVTDVNNCKSSLVNDTIHIQTPPPSQNTSTTVIIGQTVTVNGFVGINYNYTWAPLTTNLSCTTCPAPISNSTVDITYSVVVQDLPLTCFERINTHDIIIKLVASLDVPSAFTPNGDGINDLIFPGGWGIRKLNYFKIYNRWGQLLFESNDLILGWDGTFNGVPQNVETYVYQASVDTYTNETFNKSGTFKLIR